MAADQEAAITKNGHKLFIGRTGHGMSSQIVRMLKDLRDLEDVTVLEPHVFACHSDNLRQTNNLAKSGAVITDDIVSEM